MRRRRKFQLRKLRKLRMKSLQLPMCCSDLLYSRRKLRLRLTPYFHCTVLLHIRCRLIQPWQRWCHSTSPARNRRRGCHRDCRYRLGRWSRRLLRRWRRCLRCKPSKSSCSRGRSLSRRRCCSGRNLGFEHNLRREEGGGERGGVVSKRLV